MTPKETTPSPTPPTPGNAFTAEGSPPPGRVATEAPQQKSAPPAASAEETDSVDVGSAADAADELAPPAQGTATQPVRRRARIVGKVEVRQGDGTVYTAPVGPCTVQITALDATLSWVDGDTHGLAAMPLTAFNRHLLEHRIEYTDAGTT